MPPFTDFLPLTSRWLLFASLLLLPLQGAAGGGGDHSHGSDRAPSASHTAPGHDRSAAIVKNSDWLSAERLTVTFEDNIFTPDQIVLKLGKPYIIRMKNIGGDNHDMEGEHFFSSVVIREIRTDGVRMSAYHLESLYLKPEREVEVWLVPVQKGEFTFICTLPGHREDGMEGGFIIEE